MKAKLISKGIKKTEKKIKYEFHKWKKQLIIIDKVLSLFTILLLGIFRPDWLMIGVYVLIYPYLLLTARKDAIKHLVVATLIALIWMLIAGDMYSYEAAPLKLWGINLYTFFAWSSGLFAGYLIYSHWEHKLKKKTILNKMLLFISYYWPLLILAETIAYQWFGIRNLDAAMYPGLPICNCMHGPVWVKISYFLLGPIYLGVCELFRLENPHHINNKK